MTTYAQDSKRTIFQESVQQTWDWILTLFMRI